MRRQGTSAKKADFPLRKEVWKLLFSEIATLGIGGQELSAGCLVPAETSCHHRSRFRPDLFFNLQSEPGTPVLPMTLSPDDVLKVARLSRLKLTPEEVLRFADQLGHILDYVHQLDEIDTTNIEPMAHAGDLLNVFREDIPGESLDRREALSNAPKSDGKYFLVPQILEGA